MKDLKRVLNTPLYYIYMLIIILTIFVFAFMYKQTYQDDSKRSIYIENYESFEELKIQVENYRIQLDQLDENDDSYNYKKDQYSLSKYLYEKEIKHQDYKEYQSLMSLDQNNRFSFSIYMSTIVLVFLLLEAIVLAIVLFSMDFSTGISTFIYTIEKNRQKVVLRKLRTLFVLMLIPTAISLILILVLSMSYSENYHYIILMINQSIYHLSFSSMMMFIFLSLVSELVFFILIFFGLGIFTRNIFIHSTLMLLIFLFYSMVLPKINFNFIWVFTTLPIFAVSLNDVSIAYIVSIYGIKLFVSFLVFMISLIIFKRKSI